MIVVTTFYIANTQRQYTPHFKIHFPRRESMPEEPKHRKGSFGGFMDKVLHRDHHEDKDQAHQAKDEHDPDQEQHEDQPQKEGEMDRVKDYMKKDQDMEAEGRTYGDLM
ncbi:hypothetical protein N7522_004652 [Penicillium canescens]|uniref:Uncharacterized protein n=1 Tax=Penicillium canescens TaxID=5083 RepID=A0AAD6N3B0_PENCN|nr:uncharacterized protein N7446_004536 [Penicillium canescens]KAJ6009636.1 hypothetical protein N7522_004652 [Penicillium canescens]KAJ6026862.1 hypothetical protein N7460_011679 [Penicillium canescens]KAJ6040149.1 hypothetical protein N7444_009054 [Penicillium canescens]KAJ6067499.1 hypothetical protein N7446_004536 [Penicillium canescens]